MNKVYELLEKYDRLMLDLVQTSYDLQEIKQNSDTEKESIKQAIKQFKAIFTETPPEILHFSNELYLSDRIIKSWFDRYENNEK